MKVVAEIEVLKERALEHERRMLTAENEISQTAKNLTQITEQLAILAKIVYGGLGLALTSLATSIFRHKP